MLLSQLLSSVAQLCPALCDPRDCSTPAYLSITNSQSLLKLILIESVMPSSHLILCRPLLLLPPIPPRIRDSWTIKKTECQEWMLSNCGAGEDSGESLGQQGDPTSQS